MIGVSLPLDWLCGAPHALGNVGEVLDELQKRGVRCVELRTVRATSSADAVAAAATMLWERGFEITVHSSPVSARSAVSDVFAPLQALLSRLSQKRLMITLHPLAEDNALMLSLLADHAEKNHAPICFALENNRLMPDQTEGDSAAMVLSVVEEVDRPNVGICFDMGHYMYHMLQHHPEDREQLPGKRFLKRVIHTHIHALNGEKTHFPLHSCELPLAQMLAWLSFRYFGVYNVELDFDRIKEEFDLKDALYGSVDALNAAMPPCARLYADLRAQFDQRFCHALTMYDTPDSGTRFALLQSSSFLFQTNGFRWAMDIAFRNAYELSETPRRAAELLRDLDLMVISHGHEDHFEERTVRALASNELLWLIPDFLVEQALSYGVRKEKMIIARPDETIGIGPLVIRPFLGRHFRPVTGKGTAEYGYHISAEGAPSMVFPVDTRDFSLEGLPELPPADYCFANVWLGDKNGFARDYGDLLDDFSSFMLHFSDRNILFAHLYESNRRNEDMWRDEHAELIARNIHRISPQTNTLLPKPGEIFYLK